MKYFWQADPPNQERIPREDAVGVTVILLTCSYRRQEFIRVGYYVNNEYGDPELKENPPQEPDFNKVCASSFFRSIKTLLLYRLLESFIHCQKSVVNCLTIL